MKNVLFNELQQVWQRSGLNLMKPTMLMNFSVTFLFLCNSSLCVLAALVPILEETNLTTIADAFQVCSPVTQVLIKLVIIKFSFEKIRLMLNKIETKFWNKGNLDPLLELKLLSLESFISKGFKIVFDVVCIAVLVIVIRPLLFLNSQRQYPFIMYNIVDINDNKMYALMYGFQLLVCMLGPSMLIAVDGLYILFLTNIYFQLTMLKQAFSSLKLDEIESNEDEEKAYCKLKEYVNHHNLILRFIKDFGDLYSFQVLSQFLGNTLSLCMGIFLFYGGEIDPLSSLKATIIMLVFFAELIFFCAGGTLISELCQDISLLVFYSGWEKIYKKRIRFAVFMIIMRAQKPEILKAGNMFHVNLATIGQILRSAVSTFTLMTNVNSRRNK